MGIENISDEVVDWYFSTKEKLSADDLLVGLLDHGLFPEKVPPCFVVEGLADAAKDLLKDYLVETDEEKLKRIIDKNSSDYIRYEALRDVNIPRHMGIPHPAAYAVQALGIYRHWKEIATHCNLPGHQFSKIFVRRTGSGRVFEMNYKGSERYKEEEVELGWMAGSKFVVKADIASCFHSIYTHSIPWALHDKVTAKKDSSIVSLVGNFLDAVTRGTRDKQTNGLLIGPHASNIISEIILTKIDSDLQSKGYIKVCRYIDDYTYYARNLEEAERFIKDMTYAKETFKVSYAFDAS